MTDRRAEQNTLGEDLPRTERNREHPYVSYPWVGVSLFPLIPGIAHALDLKAERGALVLDVIENGPADQAGLRGSGEKFQVGNVRLRVGGDIVVSLNDGPVRDTEELVRLIRKFHPGDRVRLKILRDGRFLEKEITLGLRPRKK